MFSLEAGVAKKNRDSGNECTAAKDEPLKIIGHSLSHRPLLVDISRGCLRVNKELVLCRSGQHPFLAIRAPRNKTRFR